LMIPRTVHYVSTKFSDLAGREFEFIVT